MNHFTGSILTYFNRFWSSIPILTGLQFLIKNSGLILTSQIKTYVGLFFGVMTRNIEGVTLDLIIHWVLASESKTMTCLDTNRNLINYFLFTAISLSLFSVWLVVNLRIFISIENDIFLEKDSCRNDVIYQNDYQNCPIKFPDKEIRKLSIEMSKKYGPKKSYEKSKKNINSMKIRKFQKFQTFPKTSKISRKEDRRKIMRNV